MREQTTLHSDPASDSNLDSYLELEPGFEMERYELREVPLYRFEITRRDLFKTLGGGLLVLCLLPDALAPDAEAQESGGGQRRRGGGNVPQEIGAWLHIGEDGKVTVFSGKTEVGQNVRTSLTLAAAEDLRVPVSSIQIVLADTALTPYDAGTFGSRSTPAMVPQIRQAAVSARETLVDIAAEQWKCDRAGLKVAEGKVTDPATNRAATFGELTKGQKLTKTVRREAPLTPPDEWKVLGKSIPKVDARAIVTGKHAYTTDIKRPGMLYGKMLRPASYGATLGSLDTQGAEALSGVKVVRDGEFVGVVAPDSFSATRAIDALKATWKPAPHPSGKELYDHLKKNIRAPQRPDEGGNAIKETLAASEKALQATYTIAYIAHAPLEPRAAVAEWEGDQLTVWTGTQRPFGVRSELAQAFSIPEEKVRVITPDTGSGYGGKHTGEAAVEAARLAKAASKPVKLVWTREEEFIWAYFRPAGVIEIQGGVNRDGKITAWEFTNINSGGSAVRSPYAIPNQKSESRGSDSPLRQGSYRALASTANNFAREMFMDELAHAIKMNPLEFRLKNLEDERLRAVLEAAAQKFGWERVKSAPGRGYGLALGTEKGGYVASCAEVAVEPESGKVRLVRVVTAFECGAILHPEHLENQVEGSVIMGIGGALFETIQFENGKITNPRFSKYRVPRFNDIPVLETVLLDRKDLASAGAGEAPIICLAPAVGNAIFAATGKRLRSLPMLPDGNNAPA